MISRDIPYYTTIFPGSIQLILLLVCEKKHHIPINCLVSTSSQHVLRYSNALPLYCMIFYLIPLAVDLSTPSAVAGCSGYRSSSHNSPRRGNAPRRQRGPRVLGVCLAMKKLEFMRKFEKIGNYNHGLLGMGQFFETNI